MCLQRHPDYRASSDDIYQFLGSLNLAEKKKIDKKTGAQKRAEKKAKEEAEALQKKLERDKMLEQALLLNL